MSEIGSWAAGLRRMALAALREPLAHFAVVGAVLFAGVWAIEQGERPEIRITNGDVAQLRAYWETQTQRPPTPAELDALVQERVDEEVLAREATRLGLDRDDVIVRRRLAQKLAFVSEDLASLDEPSETALRAYYDAHLPVYATPETFALRHVYFSADRRGGSAQDAAGRALRDLARGIEAGTLGDPFMLPREFADVSHADLSREFGAAFADAVAAAPVAVWRGPVRSAFGLHLIRVESRTPASQARFEDVRDRVRDHVIQERRKQANADLRAKLRARYVIVVEPMNQGQ